MTTRWWLIALAATMSLISSFFTVVSWRSGYQVTALLNAGAMLYNLAVVERYCTAWFHKVPA